MSPWGGGHPQYIFLAQIYQGLKSLGNGLCTLTNWPQNVICVHTCMHCGLMCGIWDWQSMIVKDLNDSQDPQHICCFVAKTRLSRFTLSFFRWQMSPFYPFRGGGPPKGDNAPPFFTVFLLQGFPVLGIDCFALHYIVLHCMGIAHSLKWPDWPAEPMPKATSYGTPISKHNQRPKSNKKIRADRLAYKKMVHHLPSVIQAPVTSNIHMWKTICTVPWWYHSQRDENFKCNKYGFKVLKLVTGVVLSDIWGVSLQKIGWLVGWSVGWLVGWLEPQKQEKLKR